MRQPDPLEYLSSLEKLGIKFGLENVTRICGALGNPQDCFSSVIIAGTNGKGSVTAMMDTALRAAGLRVARYTSPHLVQLEERFVIDGVPVATSLLRAAAGEAQSTIDRLLAAGKLQALPTFFEVTTAIAFELFRRAGTELAVLEVGLGGRFDATNIVNPRAAAITSIDLDHERYLGSTIREIAFEKAGVIKPGAPVVVGETKPEAVDVIARVCRERGAAMVAAGDGVKARATMAQGWVRLELETPIRAYEPVTLGLRGRHQVANAVVAVRLLEELERQGVPLSDASILSGLRDVNWPGRLELLALGGGRDLLLDAAHNPAGARAVAAYLAEVYPAGLPLVFGAMQDKDTAGMLAALLPCASHAVMTEPHNRRAAPAVALAEQAKRLAPQLAIETEPNPPDAVTRAWTAGATICVTGSIFLAGELRRQMTANPLRRLSLRG